MRISATRLEQYRRHKAGLLTKEQLILQLSEQFTPTYVMELGTALHAVLEQPNEHLNEGTFVSNGFRFSKNVVDSMLATVPKNAVTELKETVIKDGITLVGKADALYGLTCYDFKVSDQAPRIEKIMAYQKSMQWKVYCEVFQVETVEFIFCGLGLANGCYELLDKPRVLICEADEYTSEEVWNMVSKFKKFIVQNKLERYF